MDDDCALVEPVARCHSQLRLHALYIPRWVYTSEPENRVRKSYQKRTSGLATRKVKLLRSLMRCTHHLCMAELLLMLSQRERMSLARRPLRFPITGFLAQCSCQRCLFTAPCRPPQSTPQLLLCTTRPRRQRATRRRRSRPWRWWPRRKRQRRCVRQWRHRCQ